MAIRTVTNTFSLHKEHDEYLRELSQETGHTMSQLMREAVELLKKKRDRKKV